MAGRPVRRFRGGPEQIPVVGEPPVGMPRDDDAQQDHGVGQPQYQEGELREEIVDEGRGAGGQQHRERAHHLENEARRGQEQIVQPVEPQPDRGPGGQLQEGRVVLDRLPPPQGPGRPPFRAFGVADRFFVPAVPRSLQVLLGLLRPLPRSVGSDHTQLMDDRVVRLAVLQQPVLLLGGIGPVLALGPAFSFGRSGPVFLLDAQIQLVRLTDDHPVVDPAQPQQGPQAGETGRWRGLAVLLGCRQIGPGETLLDQPFHVLVELSGGCPGPNRFACRFFVRLDPGHGAGTARREHSRPTAYPCPALTADDVAAVGDTGPFVLGLLRVLTGCPDLPDRLRDAVPHQRVAHTVPVPGPLHLEVQYGGRFGEVTALQSVTPRR